MITCFSFPVTSLVAGIYFLGWLFLTVVKEGLGSKESFGPICLLNFGRKLLDYK